MKITNADIWWGPPKKFSNQIAGRKISWLELFYDLVYVIAISKITNLLAAHPDITGLIDYIYLFSIIFWGWINGSMHHDIHGSPGIRTRFMTLWQMVIVSALVVSLSGPQETLLYRVSIAIMVMQLYITYLWWSVGIYDKNHRKLNRPYTICYLVSFLLLFLSLFVEVPYKRFLFYFSLLINYLPPLLSITVLKRNSQEFSLSSSMTERLGLFTIILFGEAVLGVINGINALKEVSFQIWVNFGLGIIIIFALWWIFFSLIADRESQKGILKGHLTQLAYLPALMSLGMIGASFSGLYRSYPLVDDNHSIWIWHIFGISLCTFLLGITAISLFLRYPEDLKRARKQLQCMLLIAGILILILTLLRLNLSLFISLLIIFLVLLVIIIVITRVWVKIELSNLVMKLKSES